MPVGRISKEILENRAVTAEVSGLRWLACPGYATHLALCRDLPGPTATLGGRMEIPRLREDTQLGCGGAGVGPHHPHS